jgi:hypothetical protein
VWHVSQKRNLSGECEGGGAVAKVPLWHVSQPVVMPV